MYMKTYVCGTYVHKYICTYSTYAPKYICAYSTYTHKTCVHTAHIHIQHITWSCLQSLQLCLH